jgi:hypothetical protein
MTRRPWSRSHMTCPRVLNETGAGRHLQRGLQLLSDGESWPSCPRPGGRDGRSMDAGTLIGSSAVRAGVSRLWAYMNIVHHQTSTYTTVGLGLQECEMSTLSRGVSTSLSSPPCILGAAAGPASGLKIVRLPRFVAPVIFDSCHYDPNILVRFLSGIDES